MNRDFGGLKLKITVFCIDYSDFQLCFKNLFIRNDKNAIFSTSPKIIFRYGGTQPRKTGSIFLIFSLSLSNKKFSMITNINRSFFLWHGTRFEKPRLQMSISANQISFLDGSRSNGTRWISRILNPAGDTTIHWASSSYLSCQKRIQSLEKP